jgi:hypothetical protein
MIGRGNWSIGKKPVPLILYMPNTVIRRDLQIPTVKEDIRRYSFQYSARLCAHPRDLRVNLMELPDNRQLRSNPPMICLPDS